MIKMDMMTVEAVFSSDPRPAPGKIPNTSAGIALTADPSAAAAAINIAPANRKAKSMMIELPGTRIRPPMTWDGPGLSA